MIHFESGITKISGPLASATDTILKIDAAVVALGATIVTFAIRDAIKLESAQIDLQKVLSDSEGSVDQYGGKIKELSLFYGVLQTDTTAALSELKQAGYSIGDSFKILENSLIATKVSELDAVEASTLLKATLKGFSLEAEASTSILDTWNETSNNFGTNTREIAVALAQVSGVAKQAGLSVDETTSLLVPMIEVFGSGAEAATALRTGLLKVSDDSAPVLDALNKLGISQTDLNGKLKSSGAIFYEVIENLKSLSDEEQQHLIKQLVGINQTDKLTQTMTKQGEIFAIQTALTQKDGSALKELEVRLKATEEAINRLNTAFKAAEDSLGGQFLQSTASISDGLKNILIAASEIIDSGGLEALFGPANDFAKRFADTLDIVAKNLPAAVASPQVQAALQDLAKSLESLGFAVGGLFGNVDLTTEQGLEDAITRLIKIFESLVNVTKGVTETYLKPLFAALEAGVGGFSDLDSSTQALIGNFLGLGKSVDVILPLVGGLLSALGGVFQLFGGIKGLKIETSLLAAASATDAFAIASKGLFLLAWGDFVYKLATWADLNDRLIPGVDTLGTKIYEWTHSSEEAANATVKLTKPMDDLGKSIDEYSDKARAAAGTSDTLAKSGSFIEQQFTAALLPFDKLIESFNGMSTSANSANDASSKIVKTLVDGVPTFTQAGTAISNSYKATGESAVEAAKKSDDYLIKMEEIASNERIKTIESTVQFNIAKLESDTKTILAAFDSVDNAIQFNR